MQEQGPSVRALQSSSQDCWPGFSSPGPGPEDEGDDEEEVQKEEEEEEFKDNNDGDPNNEKDYDYNMMACLVLLGMFAQDAHCFFLQRSSFKIFIFFEFDIAFWFTLLRISAFLFV